VFVANVVISAFDREPVGPDPWGANSLEWATSSPPPEHNFDTLPPIRSERPVFDARHPELEPGRLQ
jgi:cytochrome c oxidase subunit 1